MMERIIFHRLEALKADNKQYSIRQVKPGHVTSGTPACIRQRPIPMGLAPVYGEDSFDNDTEDGGMKGTQKERRRVRH